MKTFTNLVADCLSEITECMPWDLVDQLNSNSPPLLLDIREPAEFETMHIKGSLSVPRGILETACDWGYEETVPQLAVARDQAIVVVCRSGNRSALAAQVMQLMGYRQVVSLNTGLRGWNDYEQPLVDGGEQVIDLDISNQYFGRQPAAEQLGPL